jgi:ferredoxin
MSYQITFVESDGTETIVECEEDQYILDAGLQFGLDLPYACCVGACSACACKVIEGEVDNEEQTYLDDDQLDEGYSLLCVAYPKSDCYIKTDQESEI